MKTIEVFTIIITVLLTSATTAFIAVIKSNFKAFKILKTGQRCLMKDRIVQAHDYFCGKKSIGKYSLDAVEELYEQYKGLGGNGFISKLMEEIEELDVIN